MMLSTQVCQPLILDRATMLCSSVLRTSTSLRLSCQHSFPIVSQTELRSSATFYFATIDCPISAAPDLFRRQGRPNKISYTIKLLRCIVHTLEIFDVKLLCTHDNLVATANDAHDRCILFEAGIQMDFAMINIAQQPQRLQH